MLEKILFNLLLILVGAIIATIMIESYCQKNRKVKENKTKDIKREETNMKNTNTIVETLKNKIIDSVNNGLYMKSLRTMKNACFSVSADKKGVQVEQLGDFILEWAHFEKIVEKANELGGIMYRGDELPQQGFCLGEEISHDCMEGFIASELLGIEDGKTIVRRSTYYSGILAWAGIITLHSSQGKGSFITVNPQYRK